MSRAEVYICDGCGTEERVVRFISSPEGWSRVPGLKGKEDLCPACTGEFAAWKQQRASAASAAETERAPLSAQLVFDLLSLVKDELPRGISITEVHTWDVAAWEEVAAWASAVHLVASDNDDVVIPQMPVVLR